MGQVPPSGAEEPGQSVPGIAHTVRGQARGDGASIAAALAVGLALVAAIAWVAVPIVAGVQVADGASGQAVSYARWLLSLYGLTLALLLGFPALVSAMGYVGARTAALGAVGLGRTLVWAAFALVVVFILVTLSSWLGLLYVPSAVALAVAGARARGPREPAA